MLGKEFLQIISLFTVFLVFLNLFISGSAAENTKKAVRQKRNIICLFGLTGLISGAFYESLDSIHNYDPIFIGSLLNGKLKNGEFRGLSTLRNDSDINVYCQNEMVVLDTLMSMTNVSISSEWSLKALINFSGTISATVKEIRFHLDGTLNTGSGIVLDVNVELTKLDELKLDFSGFGPFNPVIKFIGNLILDFFHRDVSKKIEKVLKSTLESEVKNFNMFPKTIMNLI